MSLKEKTAAKAKFLEDKYGKDEDVISIRDVKARGLQLDVPALVAQISVVKEMLDTPRDDLIAAGIPSGRLEKKLIATFLGRGGTWLTHCIQAFELQQLFEVGAAHDNSKMRKLMRNGGENYTFGVSSWIAYMENVIKDSGGKPTKSISSAPKQKTIASSSTTTAAGLKRKRG